MTPDNAGAVIQRLLDTVKAKYTNLITMDILEAKAAKTALETAIAALLQQFSADTGMTVTRVDTDALPNFGASPTYVVRVEVRL
ncbi:MAG: hypothetical protein ABFD96_24670 [Armatimonadia bacterium]